MCARVFSGEVPMKGDIFFFENKYLDSDACHLHWVLLGRDHRSWTLFFGSQFVFNVKMKPLENPHPEKNGYLVTLHDDSIIIIGGRRRTPMINFGYVKIETDQES